MDLEKLGSPSPLQTSTLGALFVVGVSQVSANQVGFASLALLPLKERELLGRVLKRSFAFIIFPIR